MTTLTPYEEAVEIVLEAGGEPLKLCYQWGLCTATCPWNLVRSFGVHQIILQSQPGLVEMRESREESLCCGGGSGEIWMDTEKGERPSDIRLGQAIEVGAEVLAAACPYCMLNFEGSRLTSDMGNTIEIKDVSELLREAL